MSRTDFRLARAHAAAAAILALTPSSAALAQSTGQKTTLPEINITTAKPAPAKPKKTEAKAVPQQPVAAPVEAAVAPAANSDTPETASNAGTPSANVAPVMGSVGAPVGQTATSIDMKKLSNEPIFSVTDVLRESPASP